MPVTTRYQVDQGKKPQVAFKQLPLVQTHRRHKGKEPVSIQSPESIPKVLCDPSGDLIELSTPLGSPHSSMDMSFTRAPCKNNQSSEYNVDLLSGDPTRGSRPTSPLMEDRYLDAHQRDEKSKHYSYQEEKAQNDDQIGEPSSARVNATFNGNQFRQSRPCTLVMTPLGYASGRLKEIDHERKALLEEQAKKE